MTIFYPTTELLEQLKKNLEINKERTQKLIEENNALKDEHYKDKEIERLTKEVENLKEVNRNTFSFTKETKEKIEEWKKEHIRTRHNGSWGGGAIGGNFAYIFIPTSIGMAGSCYCTSCHAKMSEDLYRRLKRNMDAIEKLNLREKLVKEYDSDYDWNDI